MSELITEVKNPLQVGFSRYVSVPSTFDNFIAGLGGYCQPITVHTYKYALVRFQGLLDIPLEDATLTELNIALARLAQTKSPSFLAMTKTALRRFLMHLGKLDMAMHIKNRPPLWTPRDPPTSEVIDRVLSRARLTERALILTFYSTGCRMSELMGNRHVPCEGAQVGDVNWEDGKLCVRAKGGNTEYVVFYIRRDEAMDTLREYLDGRTTGKLIQVCGERAYKLVCRAGKRVGVHLHPHLLRHAAATSLLKQGLDMRFVQAFLRHKSSEMTARYERVAQYDLIEQARSKEWR